MEPEQSQNFNERLSQWVANQGFWFQVRYSMTGGGTKGTAMFHVLRMATRLLIFLVVAVIAVAVYLAKLPDSKRFNAGLKDSLQAGLSASETELGGFSRVQGQLGISRLSFKGGDQTFFNSMVVKNIRCKMGFLDGITGQWDPGTVSLSQLELELRAGADDAESAQMISNALFRKSNEVLVNSLEVADASVSWGYSERTRGSIDHSLLKIQRQDNGLRLHFKGGTLSQNWLRNLEIVNLLVVCDSEGLTFEKAEFRRGQGTVDLSGLRVSGGERPLVRGTAKIRNLGLENMLPVAARNFIEGTMSGDFRVSGSTNSLDGIGFAGRVTLGGDGGEDGEEAKDVISLREQLPLLRALSVVDFSRNYHRVDFSEGTFLMKTTGGGMELTELNLKAGDLFSLEGSLRVRLPTAEETQAALAKGEAAGGAPLVPGENADAEEKAFRAENADFTLSRAANAAKRAKEGTQADVSLSERLSLSPEMRRLEEQASERLSRTLRYEGILRITLPADAFELAPRLAAQFPVDSTLGRVPLMVPIEGSLYELTFKQAEDIYAQRSH